MRPVNLVHEEQRRRRPGAGAGRTGPLPFIVVGALAALLLGVALVVLAGNQISESKAEVAELETRKEAAIARADRLQPYVAFRELEQQRTATVASLAESRFDWVRTMRQLSLIIPPDVWLTQLTASASGEASSGGSGSIAGPSLEISGCAKGQDAVAGFVASLKQIDGVTRVGLSESSLTEAEAGGGSEGGCSGAPFLAQFDLTVAFDAAPPALTAASEAETEAAEPEEEKEEAKAEPASSTE
jgi:Tfp pilus assembly protein PilN